ncbi:CHAT domain-containing protein [Mangrovicoccus ximenensis]|uniref:CHAT domain-containing protein n=1 Tax=Mangrovicoccus ximenensis TaxID=1911570 RepID=UPI00191C270B|nr:CHAT domain-containing protein [Mangrovicoccus ximenensis]
MRGDDGYLKASEIAAMEIGARLVVPSACNTGASSGLPGAPALSGLAEAFFRAGSSTLAVSHWDVPPVPSGQFYRQFLGGTGLPGDRELPRRMQAAMLQFLQPDQPELLAHPFAWAPFFLVRGGTGPRSIPADLTQRQQG